MGACCSSNNKDRSQTFNQKNKETKMTVIELDQSNKKDDNFIDVTESEKSLENKIKYNDIRYIQKQLDDRKITINTRIGMNLTLLQYAVLKQSSLEMVEFLLDNNANINEKEDETGNTVLFFAAVDLNEDLVKLLLKHNPDITITNKKKEDIFLFLNNEFRNKKEIKNKVKNNDVEKLDESFDNKSELSDKDKNNNNEFELNPDQLESLNNILSMLNKYKNEN